MIAIFFHTLHMNIKQLGIYWAIDASNVPWCKKLTKSIQVLVLRK